MDGLSAAASIVAIFQIVNSVGRSLRELYRDVRDARSDIEQLYSTVASLESIAERVDNLIKDGPTHDGLLDMRLLDDRRGPLRNMVADLETIKQKLEEETMDRGFKRIQLSMKQSTAQRLHWPFKKEEVMKIVENLEKHKSSLTLDFGINTLNILKAIREDIKIANKDHHRVNILNWLTKSTSDPSNEHNNAIKKRIDDTGVWLLDSDDLAQWRITPNSFLWIHGGAGCGKSILCSSVIAELQEHCKEDPRTAVVYWYFTFRDATSQRFDQCLCSLVANLCSKRPDTPSALQLAYSQANNGQLSPSTDQLMKLLRTVIEGFDDVYVFLDALDECPKFNMNQDRERDELLNRLHEICSWKESCLHILTTSRRERDIEKSLAGLSKSHDPFKTLIIQGIGVKEDIRKYIRRKLDGKNFNSWDEDFKKEVEMKLGVQADGMFRLVALQLDILSKSAFKTESRRTLETLPKTLDIMYSRALSEIDEAHQERASFALQWIAFSTRILTLAEVAEIMAIWSRNGVGFNPEDRPWDQDVVFQILPAALVTERTREVLKSDYRSPPRGKPGPKRLTEKVVQFAHFSVLEYLKSDRMPPELEIKYHINELKSHNTIAESCFAYLLYIGQSAPKLAKEMEQLFELTIDQVKTDYLESICLKVDATFPLADYANVAWYYHTAWLQKGRNEVLDRLAFQFLNGKRDHWTIWCFMKTETETDVSKVADYTNRKFEVTRERCYPSFKVHPITWLSVLGQKRLLNLLLRQSPAPIGLCRTSFLGTPLHASVWAHKPEISQMLLAAGADLNERGGYFGTPLNAAARLNMVEMTRFLLASGADPSLLNVKYVIRSLTDTPGALKMTRLLLRKETKEGEVPDLGMKPLTSAAWCGSLELVDVMLEAGAWIDNRESQGTALAIAARRGHTAIVEKLLQAGADVNACGYAPYSSPMDKAIEFGRVDIVTLLLQAGANIGTKQDPSSQYSKAFGMYKQYSDICRNNTQGSKSNLRAQITMLEILALFDAHIQAQEERFEEESGSSGSETPTPGSPIRLG